MKKILSLTLAVVMLFALAMPAFAVLEQEKEITVTAGLELPSISVDIPTTLSIRMMPFAAPTKQIVSAEHKIVNLGTAPVEIIIYQAEITAGGAAKLATSNAAASTTPIIVLNMEFGAKTALLANNPATTFWPVPKYDTAYSDPTAPAVPVIYNFGKDAVLKAAGKKVATLARAENDDGKPINWGTTGEDTLTFRFNGWMNSAAAWVADDTLTGIAPSFNIKAIANTGSLTKTETLKPANTPTTLLKAAKTGDKTNIVFDAAPQKGEEIYMVKSTTTVMNTEALLEAALLANTAKQVDPTKCDNVTTTFAAGDFTGTSTYDPTAASMISKVVVVATNAVTGVKTVTLGTTLYTQPA